MYWTYIALTRFGQEVSGQISASKKDVLEQLAERQLSVIQITPDYLKTFAQMLPKGQLSALTMAVFFEDICNMLQTGLGLSQIIVILKETSKEEQLSDLLSNLEEAFSQGQSLSEAIIDSKAFPWIVSVTISSGERTGRLQESCGILARYFRHSHQIQHKFQQALIYPTIVFVLLLGVMFFITLRVIPQLKNLLPDDSLRHQTTQGILLMSFFLQKYIWVLAIGLFVIVVGIFIFQKKEPFKFVQWLYTWPVLGQVFKESALALYLLNLSVLLKSGVSLIRAIGDLNALDKTPVSSHFALSRDYMLGGTSFWESIEQDKFFPAIIPSTLRRAEEMTKLDEYCMSLAEFFNKRCSARLDGLIHLVQPALLGVGGAFLVVIALAFILPIYGSLSTIATGQ